MNDELSRFLMCLAALNLTKDGLRRLLDDLQSIPFEEINAQVSSLRKHAQHVAIHEDLSKSSSKTRHSRLRDASVGERVERLLKAEAGMSTIDAVESLTLRLAAQGLIDQTKVPPLSRKSLRDWISRLGNFVSEKDILRHSTIIRNERVHGPTRDWMLSRLEK